LIAKVITHLLLLARGKDAGVSLVKGRQPEYRPLTASLGHPNGDLSMLALAPAPVPVVA
jgi:hypothetical protein